MPTLRSATSCYTQSEKHSSLLPRYTVSSSRVMHIESNVSLFGSDIHATTSSYPMRRVQPKMSSSTVKTPAFDESLHIVKKTSCRDVVDRRRFLLVKCLRFAPTFRGIFTTRFGALWTLGAELFAPSYLSGLYQSHPQLMSPGYPCVLP